jgi:hypothetical protein
MKRRPGNGTPVPRACKAVPLSIVSGGHTALRAEIYIDTPNVNVDIGTTSLQNVGLANADFEIAGPGPNGQSCPL